MALTQTYQRVAHALDWLVKVWRDPSDNSTVQAVLLVDTDGNPTTSGGSSIPTAIVDNSENVVTAGTRVQLTTATCKKIIITAKAANTGTIWVGGATVAAGRGIPLVALQNVTLDISNANAVYIDATVNGEGITYAYLS